MKLSTKFLGILAVGFTLGLAAHAADKAAGVSANMDSPCPTCHPEINQNAEAVVRVKQDFKAEATGASGVTRSAKDCPPDTCGPE